MALDFKGKKVLFITTKNLDYIRNTQEMGLIRKDCKSLDIIGSDKKSYFKRLIKVYFGIIKTNMKKYDCVFIGFAPQLVIPFFKWKFRKNYVVIDFFISMYDTLAFDRKKFKPGSIPGRLLKKFDTVTVKRADLIISDTREHGKYFISEFGASPDKIYTLYLEADKSVYHPMQVERPDNIRDKFVVLYFGSILPLQGIDVILKAFDLLKDEKNLHFYMIGPIPEKVNKPLNDNIEYISWLPQKKLAEYIAMSDLCLAGHFNKNNNKANRTIPGKAYTYEAMEKPMVLGDNPATRERYTDSSMTYFVEMGNPSALAELIRKIGKDSENG